MSLHTHYTHTGDVTAFIKLNSLCLKPFNCSKVLYIKVQRQFNPHSFRIILSERHKIGKGGLSPYKIRS
jgi:hypothetical protein